MVSFKLNGETVSFDGDENMPILWYVREQAGLPATKFGCGIGSCGACTVHIDGQAVRSCITPVAAVEGQDVTTHEGLGSDLHQTVKEVWEELEVVQCGYCQPGQMMSAIALLSDNSAPSDDDIDAAMDGNLCRCATYHRIRAAIHEAAKRVRG